MPSKRQTELLQNIKYQPLSLNVVLVLFFGKLFSVNGQVSLSEFMPYKESEAANVINLHPSIRRKVELGFTFNYYGQEYTSVYIRSNGWIEVRRMLPNEVIVGCTPFGSRLYSSTRGNFNVSYKMSQDKALLSRLSNDISKSSSELQNVSLTNLFAATWDNVQQYMNTTFRNTFQAVLTTDGFNSFVLFYYNKVETPPDMYAYAILTNNAGSTAQEIKSTPRNISALLNSSNINVPGKWLFQVYPCSSLKHFETISNHIFFASKMRQGALFIPLYTFHCILPPSAAIVNCKIEGQAEVYSTAGILLADNQILCPLPLFVNSGNFSFKVVVTFTHNSIMMTRTITSQLLVGTILNSAIFADLSIQISNSENLMVNASWNPHHLEVGGKFPCCGFESGHTSIHLLKLEEQGGWVDQGNISTAFENLGFYTGTLDMSALKESSYNSELAIVVQQSWKFNDSFVLRKQITAKRLQVEKFRWIARSIKQHKKLIDTSKHIPVFGNVPLLLKLPFTPKSTNNVKCVFLEANNNFQTSKGMILSEEHSLVICPVPFLSFVGLVDLHISFGNNKSSETFFETLYAAREEDCGPENFAQIFLRNTSTNAYASLHVRLDSAWKYPFLLSDVFNFTNNFQAQWQIVFYNYNESKWEEIFASQSFPISADALMYITEQELRIIFSSGNQIAVGIRETYGTNLCDKLSGVTFLRMKDASLLINDLKEFTGVKTSKPGENAECKAWHELEEFSTKRIMPCPKTVTQAKRDWKFIAIDDKTSFAMNEKTPFAFAQALASDSGKGVLCLYDSNGTLSNKSHSQRSSSSNRKNYWDHYFHDAIPFLHCCGVTVDQFNCRNFYLAKRAPEDGSNYAPPKFVLAVSTGKIFPISGTIRRVLSFGEFWALNYYNKFMMNQIGKSFKMQVRVEQYVGVDGKARPLPVITAVAMLDQNRHKKFSIQVSRELTNSKLVIQINKDEPLQLYASSKQNSSQILYTDQATIQYFSSSGKLLVTFLSGFSVMVTTPGENEMGMNFIISATAEQFKKSTGLLASKPTYRHTENGSKHTGVDSVEATENLGFQNTELVLENDSIFANLTDRPYSFYYRPDVTLKLPDTIATGYGMQSNCKVNPIIEGMMDLLLTGSESVANSTRDVTKYFVDLSEN